MIELIDFGKDYGDFRAVECLNLKIGAGEMLIALDDRIMHGRTAFVDAPGAIPAIQATPGDPRPLKRTMERFWIDVGACT